MINRAYEITLQLIIKDFRARYKGTLLGYAWALVTPLIFASIFNFVFQRILRFEIDNYPLFLVSGLFAWQWFSNSISGAAGCFLQNAALIKKINFPRYLLPFSVVLIDALHFLLAIPIILAFLFVWNKPVLHFSWVYGLPIVGLTQLAIIYGVTLCVSSLNTVFRDIDKIVNLLVIMLFYLTPVFYPLSVIPENFRNVIQLNPMTGIITSWQNLFLIGKIEWVPLLISMVWAVVLVLVGAGVYKKINIRFAEVL